MRRWFLFSTVSHGCAGLCLGVLGVAIFQGVTTAAEALALFAVAMAVCVGAGQAAALRGRSPGALRWGLVTTAAILAGLALPEWLGSDAPSPVAPSWRGMVEVALAAALLGLLVGAVQWAFALHRPDALRWIGLTVLGWTLSLSCSLAGVNLVTRLCLLPADGWQQPWPLWAGLAMATACGALGGAAYGALTAPALRPAAA
ncbi:hypothetical protein [Gymnodinialimonas ulvae]|uniref:hypothetical protein n=1 Tax=Gymnodinialimonas ulvae TaxID=3126504 RepID=UPI0030A5123F